MSLLTRVRAAIAGASIFFLAFVAATVIWLMGARNPYRINLDATRDGQRFLINTVAAINEAKPLSVVVNWTKGLEPAPRQ